MTIDEWNYLWDTTAKAKALEIRKFFYEGLLKVDIYDYQLSSVLEEITHSFALKMCEECVGEEPDSEISFWQRVRCHLIQLNQEAIAEYQK